MRTKKTFADPRGGGWPLEAIYNDDERCMGFDSEVEFTQTVHLTDYKQGVCMMWLDARQMDRLCVWWQEQRATHKEPDRKCRCCHAPLEARNSKWYCPNCYYNKGWKRRDHAQDDETLLLMHAAQIDSAA